MYVRYCRAAYAAENASAAAKTCYAAVVHAVVVAKTLQLNTVYGDWKLSTVWEAGPLAWRPRPLYEYSVVRNPSFAPEPMLYVVLASPSNPHALLAEYAQALQAESDAYGAEGAAYRDLIAAYLCDQLLPTEREQITDTPAKATGIAAASGSVRCYIMKPAVEPAKKSRKSS
jgi:hypothetical protein